MQKWIAGVLLVLAAILGWQTAVVLRDTPTYQGKSPRYWLNYEFKGTRAAIEERFREVWTGLGSNAVPFLVKALERQDNGDLELKYIVFLEGTAPPSLRNILPKPGVGPSEFRRRAAIVLGSLGEDARPAIPALLKAAQTDPNPEVRYRAVMALHALNYLRIIPEDQRG